MEAVRVSRWLKSVGDRVTAGEPLVEVETEKSMVEIEAAATGLLVAILVQSGEEATVGDAIAQIESEGPHPSPLAPAPALRERPGERAPSTLSPASRERAGVRADRLLSTPAARRRAAEHSLDLAGIPGAGPRGRVQLQDVERALRTAPTETSAHSRAQSSPGLPPMRRALARAMTLSNATAPQFFVARAVDW